MEPWPANLPQQIKADYSIEPRCGLADEKEERNPQRLRTYPEYDAVFSIRMTSGQKDVFRSWHNGTLNQCKAFAAPWLETLGFDFHFLRFTNPPSWKYSGANYWTITLPVEIIAGVETDSEGNPNIYKP